LGEGGKGKGTRVFEAIGGKGDGKGEERGGASHGGFPCECILKRRAKGGRGRVVRHIIRKRKKNKEGEEKGGKGRGVIISPWGFREEGKKKGESETPLFFCARKGGKGEKEKKA